MAQAAERLRLDLADALAGHAELLAHLFERHRPAVVQTEPEADDLVLALRERRDRGDELFELDEKAGASA